MSVLPAPACDPGVATVSSKGIGAGYTRIITNTLINEFRFSWATMGIFSEETQDRNEIIPGALDLAVNSGISNFSVSNINGLGDSGRRPGETKAGLTV